MAPTASPADALQSAAKIIAEHIKADENVPDLADLVGPGRATSAYVESPAYVPEQFVISKVISLPDILFEQYDLLRSRCFMGLFPEIDRAWITIDHRLFLWNYNQRDDFMVYEELDQIILGAKLVKPRPGVFEDSIDYILVIATLLDVTLLGVSVNKETKEVALLLTPLSVRVDGIVTITAITGSADGRIFVIGDKPDLFEITYSAKNRWFGSRCQLVNLTATVLFQYLPTYLPYFGTAPESLCAVVVDDARKLLYTATSSAVQVYHLGQNSGEIARVTTIDNVQKKAVSLTSSSVTPGEIVAIHPVTQQESSRLLLVAVTSTGLRLYIGYAAYYGSGSKAPVLLNARIAPPTPTTGPTAGMHGSGHAHMNWYSRGILVVAEETQSEEADWLRCAAVDTASYVSKCIGVPRDLVEISERKVSDSKTWALAERMTNVATDNLWQMSGKESMNEMLTQLRLPPRELMVMSTSGLSIISKHRPIEVLARMLAEEKQLAVEKFMQSYGSVQTCSMALFIGAGFVSGLSNRQAAINHATTVFTKVGRMPSVAEVGAKPVPTSNDDLGMPVAAPETVFSSRHDAIALSFARLARPLWKQQLLNLIIPSALSQTESALLARLSMIQEELVKLLRFVANILPEKSDSWNVSWHERSLPEGIESQSLDGILALVRRTNEVISFLAFVTANNAVALVDKLPAETRPRIKELTLESLVIDPAGSEFASSLIIALINSQSNQRIEVDTVSETLRELCPTFCNPTDILVFKGMENLRHAKATFDEQAANAFLKASLSFFRQAAGHMKAETFEQVISDFNSRGFFAGSVALALARAMQAKKLDQADQICEGAYKSAVESVAMVLRSGGQEAFKQHVLDEALASDDFEFQCALFQWFIDQKLYSQLLALSSQSVERYLAGEPATFEKTELLSRLLVVRHRYFEAGCAQRSLAKNELFELDLNSRMQYLSMALGNIRSEAGADTDNVSLTQEISDELDVAHVQLIVKSKLEQLEGTEDAVRTLDRKLVGLEELFHGYASPNRMLDAQVVILHAADIDDYAVIQNAWESLLAEYIQMGESEGRHRFEVIKQRVGDVCRHVCRARTFPINAIFERLQEYGWRQQPDTPRNWALDILLDAGTPFLQIFTALDSIISAKATAWQETSRKIYLYSQAVQLIRRWMEQHRTTRDERSAVFDARYVEDALSRYLLDAPPACPAEVKHGITELIQQVSAQF